MHRLLRPFRTVLPLLLILSLLAGCAAPAVPVPSDSSPTPSESAPEPSSEPENSTEAPTEPLPPSPYTRADLEAMMMEVAWAYRLKGNQVQYTVTTLSSQFDKQHYGLWRVSEDVSPEYACRETTLYSYCGAYVWLTLLEAFGHRWMDYENVVEALVRTVWETASLYEPETVLCRWAKQGKVTDKTAEAYGFGPDDLISMAEVRAFIGPNGENLRPGDVLAFGDHIMMYAGGGYILHLSGDSTDAVYGGVKRRDEKGAIKLSTVKSLWMTPGKHWALFEDTEMDFLVFLRPLDHFLLTDDGDDDLSNDRAKPSFTVPEATLSRLAYPGLVIDRSVDTSILGSPASGSEVRCEVLIRNASDDEYYLRLHPGPSGYHKLTVTEKIPAGTEAVPESISHGGVLSGDTVTWVVDVPAGASLALSYSVRVTAPRGSTVVFEGGTVGRIPSNRIALTVSGQKLDAAARDALASLAGLSGEELALLLGKERDLGCFSDLFRDRLGASFPDVSLEDYVRDVFLYDLVSRGGRSRYRSLSTVKGTVFELRNDADLPEKARTARALMIPGLLTGSQFLLPEEKTGTHEETVDEFFPDYFEPGDIFVTLSIAGYVPDGIPFSLTLPSVGIPASFSVGYQFALCLEEGCFLTVDHQGGVRVLSGQDALNMLWSSYGNALSFCLRPSLVSDNLNLEE